ncbi:hypothetical protein ABTY98_41290 [Streptomyces sp. NPDC096040]
MVRKFSFAHVIGVGVLLCCAAGTGANTYASGTLSEAYIDWNA